MLLDHQKELRPVIKLDSFFIIHTFFKDIGSIWIKFKKKLDDFFHPHKFVSSTCANYVGLTLLGWVECPSVVIDKSF